MKKIVILACALCLMSTAVFAGEEFKRPDYKNPPSKEEMIKMRKAREAAFEQKLGLTDEQILIGNVGHFWGKVKNQSFIVDVSIISFKFMIYC